MTAAIRTGKRGRRAKKTGPASPAVAADIWEDRDGKARPTPERRSRGQFVLRDTDDAGITCAADEASTMLDQLYQRQQITADQRDAGIDLAALLRRMQMVSDGRSCIDFTPVGFERDDSDDWQARRDNDDRRHLYLSCGMATWAELRRVCVEQHRPRDMERLRSGLTICAKWWA